MTVGILFNTKEGLISLLFFVYIKTMLIFVQNIKNKRYERIII